MNISEKVDILNRCYNELLSRGIIEGKTDMAIKMGIHRSSLSASFNGNEKYFTDALLSKIKRMTDLLMNQSDPHTTNIHQSANGRNINQHAEAMNAEQFLKLLAKKDEQMDRLITIIENLQNK